MLFDEQMVIDAQKYALNAKASIQRNIAAPVNKIKGEADFFPVFMEESLK